MQHKFYLCLDGTHHKNVESIRKMLQKQNVPFVERSDLRGIDDSYTVAICPNRFFAPYLFPKNCKVLFGPHFFVFPEDSNHPLFHHPYDTNRFFYNVLSSWNEKVHQEFRPHPPLPYVVCPFGIDTDSIQPSQEEKTKIVVYFKNRHSRELQSVCNYLQQQNQPYSLFRYGSYNDGDYKRELQEAKFIIWIGCHESQGFAFQECMAMNVPILLWDAESMYKEMGNDNPYYEGYRNRGFQLKTTTANVWSDSCGIRFTQESEFVECFQRMLREYPSFHPREEIEKTVSLTKAYENLLKQLGL